MQGKFYCGCHEIDCTALWNIQLPSGKVEIVHLLCRNPVAEPPKNKKHRRSHYIACGCRVENIEAGFKPYQWGAEWGVSEDLEPPAVASHLPGCGVRMIWRREQVRDALDRKAEPEAGGGETSGPGTFTDVSNVGFLDCFPAGGRQWRRRRLNENLAGQ